MRSAGLSKYPSGALNLCKTINQMFWVNEIQPWEAVPEGGAIPLFISYRMMSVSINSYTMKSKKCKY